MYQNYFKRILDVILASIAIICLSPLLITTAILVKSKLGSPVIFKQKRAGLNCKPFVMYKFRSMTDSKDVNGNLLPDEDRLTSFGKKLRASSVDELPELFNIIKGDMSIIGPRPLLIKYLERYNKRQIRRHDVRPGLSNLSAISGRNLLTWEEKFEMDVWYTENVSFLLDFKIILKTIQVVLSRKGAVLDNGSTRNEFLGNKR